MKTFCEICPISCKTNRNEGFGACSVNNLKIAKYGLFNYEEPCISFKNGSGAVFFCGCSLKCVFCQNYELSRNLRGKDITPLELANIFKELEDMGADNINLVNPTHYIDYLIEAFEIYKPNIPIVYNTHSYEKVESLKLIDSYVDIYLADMKFFDPEISKRYTNKSDYFDYADNAIKFMTKKPLVFDDNGKMLKGTIVRHLILPLCVNDSVEILKWFTTLDNAYLSLMSQYTPFGDIKNFAELNRKITKREYNFVLNKALELDIKNLFLQESSSADCNFIPVWTW